MKIYTAKNAEVGEGVEATVLFHKDTGDELICVTEGAEAFEKQNPKAKESTKEDADKLLAKESLKIRVPSKKERRKKNKKLKDEDIVEEINDEKTPTVDIVRTEEVDPDGNPIQKLTYYEDMEVKSIDDYLAAQESQNVELEEIEIEDDVLPEEAQIEEPSVVEPETPPQT